jgi:hypothetical protein
VALSGSSDVIAEHPTRRALPGGFGFVTLGVGTHAHLSLRAMTASVSRTMIDLIAGTFR